MYKLSFAKPMTTLRQLSLNDDKMFSYDQALIAIARSTGALREVKLVRDGRIQTSALYDLACCNPLLEKVAIYALFDGKDIQAFCISYMIDILKSFVECKSERTNFLKVTSRLGGAVIPSTRMVDVDNACVPYRPRSLSITLNGVEYHHCVAVHLT